MSTSPRSILTVRAFSIAGFVALGLLFLANGAFAQIDVDPDDVITDVEADGVRSNCADASCSVSADFDDSTLMASTSAGASETKEVEAILSAAFDVSADNGETKLIGSMISLNVSAEGVLTATGADSSAGYRLDVQVVDESAGDMLVATQKIGESSVEDGTEEVSVMEPVVLPVSLTRGHSYSVELVLFLEAVGDAAGSASADFASTASWEDLTIAAGSDAFGPIADLDERVDDLETDVADLREDFENHTHEYLTGRGRGHNNTEATTTTPDFPDGSGASPGSDSDGSDDSTGSGSDDGGASPGSGSDGGGSTWTRPPVVVQDDDDDDDDDSSGSSQYTGWWSWW